MAKKNKRPVKKGLVRKTNSKRAAKTFRRIKDTSKTYPKVDINKLAKELGAEIITHLDVPNVIVLMSVRRNKK